MLLSYLTPILAKNLINHSMLYSAVLSGIGEDCEDEDADVVGIDGNTDSTSVNRSETNHGQIEIVGMRQEENGTESGGKQFYYFSFSFSFYGNKRNAMDYEAPDAFNYTLLVLSVMFCLQTFS